MTTRGGAGADTPAAAGVAETNLAAGGAPPTVYGFRVVRKYRHDPEAYTQGLLWVNGSLFESTGLHGKSVVREVQLGEKGAARVVREVRVSPELFGEGIAHWHGELLQVFWQRPDGLRYSVQAGEGGHLKLKTGGGFRTPLADGWGLTTDDKAVLITDGGPDIFYLDPSSFQLRRTLRVHDAGRPVEMVNELEIVDGEVWANVYGTECLARISPSSGAVSGWVLLHGLLDRRKASAAAAKKGRQPPEVLNGIAWDPGARRLFVTGKMWPALYEIEVVPDPGRAVEEARRLCIPTRNFFKAPAPGSPYGLQLSQ